MKNRGRTCPCGAGRGFRTEGLARNVHDQMTLTQPHYYQCPEGAWHWRKETT